MWKKTTRDLLLEIIPKVELTPVVVPERIKRKKNLAQQYSESLSVKDAEEAKKLLKTQKK